MSIECPKCGYYNEVNHHSRGARCPKCGATLRTSFDERGDHGDERDATRRPWKVETDHPDSYHDNDDYYDEDED